MDIVALLKTICGVGAVLCVFAGLVLYAVQNFTDSSGGQGYGRMIVCFMSAVAFAAAYAFIAANQSVLNITI